METTVIMDDEDEDLITLFSGLSIRKDKILSLAIEEPRRLARLTQTMNKERLSVMATSDLLGFWFIALKRAYPREIFRLYEMNQFVTEYGNMARRRPTGWLDYCLTKIYDEIIVPIDGTIFYPESFIDEHFQTVNWDSHGAPNISFQSYFTQFVLKTDQILFTRFLNLEKDRTLLNDMSRRSLNSYYTKNGRHMCINQYNDKNYTMDRVIGRATLFYTVVALFKRIRVFFAPIGHESPDIHSEKIVSIRALFDAIRLTVESGGEETFDIERLPIELVSNLLTPTFFSIVKRDTRALLRDKYGHFNEGNNHYSVLFSDPDYDNELRVDRKRNRWILPFDEEVFMSKKEDKQRAAIEIDSIMKQESMLWMNLLIYEIYVNDVSSSSSFTNKNKTKRAEAGDGNQRNSSDSPKKKIRTGHAIMTKQLDKTNLLSIVRGNGILSVYYHGGVYETYKINAGDNIQMPHDMKEYLILYDKV